MAADRDRANRIRIAVRFLLDRGELSTGDLTRIAGYYGVSRERVRQLKDETAREIRRERIAAHRPDLNRFRREVSVG